METEDGTIMYYYIKIKDKYIKAWKYSEFTLTEYKDSARRFYGKESIERCLDNLKEFKPTIVEFKSITETTERVIDVKEVEEYW